MSLINTGCVGFIHPDLFIEHCEVCGAELHEGKCEYGELAAGNFPGEGVDDG